MSTHNPWFSQQDFSKEKRVQKVVRRGFLSRTPLIFGFFLIFSGSTGAFAVEGQSGFRSAQANIIQFAQACSVDFDDPSAAEICCKQWEIEATFPNGMPDCSAVANPIDRRECFDALDASMDEMEERIRPCVLNWDANG
ncbi:MAG: hypothetical protein RLO21_12030 [Nitratireductor sp.]